MNLKQIKLNLPIEINKVEAALYETILFTKERYQCEAYPTPSKKSEEIPRELYVGEKSNLYWEQNQLGETMFEDYVFAGGAFSNMYIHQHTDYQTAFKNDIYPFKDIDVFIDTNNFDYLHFKSLLPEAVFSEEPRYVETYNGTVLDYIFDFTLNDIKFEFILSDSLETVDKFDIRFRNFFHKNGKTFASERALQDIERKEIVIISTSSPSSSLVRGFIFEEQMGFTFPPFSLELIGWELGMRSYPVSLISEYLDKKTLLHTTEERIKEKLDVYYQGRIGRRDEKRDVILLSPDDNYASFSEPENEIEEFFLQKLNTCPFTNIPGDLLWSWKSNWREDEYEDLFAYSTLDIFNKPIPLNMNYDFGTTWKKHKSDLILLMRQNFLTQMFSRQNPDNYFSDDLASIDLETLLSFMENCPEDDQLKLLREMDNDHVVIQALMKWVDNVRMWQIVDDEIMNTLDGFILHHSFVELAASTSKVSLDNQIIVANWTSQFANYHFAEYTFRLCDRGVYLLDNTESDDTFLFKEENLRLIISHLIHEYPGHFDFGIEGDTANANSHINGSHYFKYDEEKDKYVLKLN